MNSSTTRSDTPAEIVAHLNPEQFAPLLASFIAIRWASECHDQYFTEQRICPKGCSWKDLAELDAGRLKEAFQEDLIPGVLKGARYADGSISQNFALVCEVLRYVDSFDSQAIKALFDWVNEQPFATKQDRLEQLKWFDHLTHDLSKTFAESADLSKRKSRSLQRHTRESASPSLVTRLIGAIAHPKNGQKLYDPAIGSAMIVSEIVAALTQRQAENQDLIRAVAESPLEVYGSDLHRDTLVIGLTRLLLSGAAVPHLRAGDALLADPPLFDVDDRFDLIVAEPPFSQRVPSTRIKTIGKSTVDATLLWIEHVVDRLAAGGRAFVVVPDGFLARGGLAQHYRGSLIKRHLVEAVVSLPAFAYEPVSKLKASILILKEDKARDSVRFLDADNLWSIRTKAEMLENSGEAELEDYLNFLGDYLYAKEYSDEGNGMWDVSKSSLKERDWDLRVINRERLLLQLTINMLAPDVDVLKLGNIAELLRVPKTSWEAAPPSATWTDEIADSLVPIVSFNPIKSRNVGIVGETMNPKISPEMQRYQLRAGDILIGSTNPRALRVALVGEEFQRCVPESNQAVLRLQTTNFLPEFIAAYLEDEDVHDWLKAMSTGAGAFTPFSARTIESIPVPALPFDLQKRYAHLAQSKKQSLNDFALEEWQISDNEERIARDATRWASHALSFLETTRTRGENIDQMLGELERLTRIEPLAIPQDQISDSGKRFFDTYLALAALALEYTSISSASADAVSLFSILEKSQRDIERIISRLAQERKEFRFDRWHEARLKVDEFLRSILHFSMEISECLLEEAEIELTSDIKAIPQGSETEVAIRITNLGRLPLRGLTLDFQGMTREVDFLAPGKHSIVHISVPPQADRGPISVPVFWRSRNLRGQVNKGQQRLKFKVESSSADRPTDFKLAQLEEHHEFPAASQLCLDSELISRKEAPAAPPAVEDIKQGSPYVCGDPVRPDRNEMFFGRKDLMDQIRRHIIQSGNVILLEGNRRAGKTSILRHLEGTEQISGWLAVYSSLQGAEGSADRVGVPTESVFRELANCIARAVHASGLDTPLPDGSEIAAEKRPLGISRSCRQGISTDAPFDDFQEYMEVLMDLLEEHDLKLLLMLDEFDKLQEGIDNGVTSPQVPENIRFMVQSYPRFSAVLTGSRRLQRLREEYWSALFGFGTTLSVSSLSTEAARTLVTKPVEGLLTYSDEAVEAAIELTACQPYLLQCLCNRIFDRAVASHSSTVSYSSAMAAAKDLVRNNEHFASLWSYINSDRRRLIVKLCDQSNESGAPIRLGELSEKLAQLGIDCSDKTLVSDIELLRELEVMNLTKIAGENGYELTVPLMGIWLKEHQDFEALVARAQVDEG